MYSDERPNPYYILKKYEKEENTSQKGKLKIFFGYAAGVGKTFSMLTEAHELKMQGHDVVIGYVEPHARPETIALLNGLEEIKPRQIKYKGITLQDFDLDAALKRKPETILVDEFAHSNVKGMRHKKRWQDIEELLNAGINVYTTLNVQHIESLNDIVESITQISVRETIPDKVFDDADKVELIDIEPEELLKRFSDGKVYRKEQAKRAFVNFFTKNNLFALREIALRRAADRVNYEVENVRLSRGQINIVATSEQILACISSSPSSSRIIRTAARMAEAFHCRWICLYVESPTARKLNKEDRDRLAGYFSLAEELGGEVVTLQEANVEEEIIEFARFRNVTKVIIGKNHRKTSRVFRYYAKDIVDKIMDSKTNMDVYVIPNSASEKPKRPKVRFEIDYSYTLWDSILAAMILSLTTVLASILDRIGFAEANVILLFIIGIIFIYVTTSSQIIGIASSFIGVMAFNYLFTDPRYTFIFYDKSYLATFPFMMLVAIVLGTLTNKIKKEAHLSRSNEKRTQILYRISKKLLSAKDSDEIVKQGIKYISRLVNRTVVCYVRSGNNLSAPEFFYKVENEKVTGIDSKDEEAAAYWTFIHGKESGTGTKTFYGAKGYYLPIKGHKEILGVIGISCEEGTLDLNDKYIFETIASQMSIALERESFAKQQENYKVEIEKEHLRGNLLRSISHDLRSPLAGMKGSLCTIIEHGDELDEDIKNNLLMSTYQDTEWLIRLIENLLSITKLDDGRMHLEKEPEIVEEVVYQVANRTKQYYKNHKLKLVMPEQPIILPMNVNLIEQVLLNLIDNAVKYSPLQTEIQLKVFEMNHEVYFEVSDHGKGISQETLPHIFERFYTDGSAHADSRRGVGLGLAICKAIVDAHGGEIVAINKKEGGALFRFHIPQDVEGGNHAK